MSRTRLTDKTAAEAGDNDLYTMNGARPTGNVNPGDKYEIGGPDQFGETPISTADTKKLHDKDVNDRNDQNIPNLREASEAAIRTAAELEKKAIRCLVASQRMLPGAAQHIIEANAADLIRLPLASIDAILGRQEAFARRIASEAEEAGAGAGEGEGEGEGAGEGAGAGAAPIAPGAPAPAPITPEAAAPAAPVAPVVDPAAPGAQVTPEAAAANPAIPTDFQEAFKVMAAKVASLEAALAKKAENEEDCEVGKDGKDGKDGTVKFASAEDSLDSVFTAAATPASKRGATSLTGMVRQASAAGSDRALESLWQSAPDVSGLF